MDNTTDGFRYAAFISYRHLENDRKWAKWLHSALERYRFPKVVQQTYQLLRAWAASSEMRKNSRRPRS